MPDHEVAQALRILRRHDFEGVSFQDLTNLKDSIETALVKLQKKCSHQNHQEEEERVCPDCGQVFVDSEKLKSVLETLRCGGFVC